MTYRLSIIPRAQRDVDDLDSKLFAQVIAAITALGKNPRPPGSVKLSDEENGFRIRPSYSVPH
jgi:mRNA-degrading endonuclease RelE of RelBE toxin-antitoxin system